MKGGIRNYTSAIVDRVRGRRPRSLVAENLDRQNQMLLAGRYRDLVAAGRPLPGFAEAEFCSYAQNGEDGILLMIFAAIGAGTRRVVEMCAGNGIECNAANLIINHGWSGLLLDGREANIARGRAFYAKRTNAWRFRRLPPTLVHAWITTQNVNDLVRQNGMEGEIDLFSLDMDGVDYWIWKALECVSPRVVVLEYNNRWAADQSVTVPYESGFVGKGVLPGGAGYFGASLLAFTRLAREKGYRLIGANGPDTNAFFMRDDVGAELFPEVTVESCLQSDYARHQHRTKYPLIQHLPVVEV
ncbi:MAG TPA: hypothetical protein VFJ82_01395 [Longimicrobium sp.]|nr:hypothetical protein [Longimicrobium sp.]